MQEYQGEPCYLIEDEFNSRFYRVGIAEYNFISLLDGSTSVSKAVAATAVTMGDKAIKENEAITICKWLVDSGLATTAVSRSAGRLIESHDEADRKKKMAKLNPVTPKFPLFNPDRFLHHMNRAFGWLFSFPMFIVWLAVVLVAIYHVWANWALISGGASAVLAPENWFWLAFTWVGLKIFHELAHGIVCKRFEGEVRQAGIVLIVMIPLPYVDVTSSWRFSSKWHRIYVAAAGMYVEVFVAAIAALVWCYADIGPLRQHMFNIMLAGSITTVFFNANPLMRFDGYYMLTDWLEMPNLGSHGQQWSKWLGKKYYLGLDVKQPTWPEGRGWIVGTYAILALLWKVIICVGLALAAESLLFGLGLILAAVAVVLWVLFPIGKLLKFVFIGEETQESPSKTRFLALTAVLGMCIYGFLAYVPWLARIKAPAIVEYQEKIDVRTSVSGFLRQLHVDDDAIVEEGQLLAVLENEELDAEILKIEMQLRLAELKARKYKNENNIPAQQVEQQNFSSLQERLNLRLGEMQKLEIRAPRSGQLLAENLDAAVGTYLPPGHHLLSIGSNANKEVLALISQHDVEHFQARQGSELDVHIWGFGSGHVPAMLDQVNPRGQLELPHPAFSSTTGGPLAVKYRPPSEDEEQQEFELVNPHFLAQVSLSERDSQRLRSGQTGFISFRTSRGSVGEVLSEKLVNWFRQQRLLTQQALK